MRRTASLLLATAYLALASSSASASLPHPARSEHVRKPSPGPVATATPTPAPTAAPAALALPWSAWRASNNQVFFGSAWEARQAAIDASQLTITLDNVGCPESCAGSPLATAQLYTSATYGYGLFQIQIQTANDPSGTNTAFFTYMDPTGLGLEDEIDAEFLSDEQNQLSTNFYHDGNEGVQKIVNLKFNASSAVHTYGINWTPASIQWLVDGQVVATDAATGFALPVMPPQVYVSLWTAGPVGTWFGPFIYEKPLTATFSNPTFTPYAP